MKHLQKFCFALAVLAVSITGCNKVTDAPLTVVLGIKEITIQAGQDTIKAVKGANGVYTATLSTQTAEITVAPSDKTAAVTIDAVSGATKNITFNSTEPEKTVEITVSKAGKKADYTLNLTYTPPSTEITITAVYDTDKSVTASKNGDDAYILSIPAKNADITVTPKDSKAAVSIDNTRNGKTNVSFSDFGEKKTFKITVENNGIKKTYTLTVSSYNPSAAQLEPKLTSLAVLVKGQEAAFEPAFNPSVTNYTVRVAENTGAIKVSARAAEGLTIEGAETEYTITQDQTKVTVTVYVAKAPASKRVYTITVNKAPAAASSQANLKTLTILPMDDGLSNKNYYYEWDKPFKGTETAYTYTTLGKFDGLQINAVPEDSAATMTISQGVSGAAGTLPAKKDHDVTIGKNTEPQFTITVTAPDNTTKKIYTIQVKRYMATFALKKLDASGVTVGFDPEQSSKLYQVTAPHTLAQTTLTAEAAFPEYMDVFMQVDGGGEKKLTGPETIPLQTGETAKITLTVKAKNPKVTPSYSENVYRLQITRAPDGAEDASLKSLKAAFHNGLKEVGLRFNETFAPETLNYTITLTPYIKDIRLEAVPNDSKASIQGWGGSHKNEFPVTGDGQVITVAVAAQNGIEKNYTVTIRLLPPLEIKAPDIPDSLDVSTVGDSFVVSGTFTDPEKRIAEIWVGSRALPINMHEKKWVQATINEADSSFTADFKSIKELGNGIRDIRIIAFDAAGWPVGELLKSLTIIGSSETVYTVNITATTTDSSPKYDLHIFVYDAEYAVKHEKVLVGYEHKKASDAWDDLSYGVTVSPRVMCKSGRTYFIEVLATSGHKTYYGKTEPKQINYGDQFTVPLKLLQ